MILQNNDFGFFIFGNGKDVLIQSNLTGLH